MAPHIKELELFFSLSKANFDSIFISEKKNIFKNNLPTTNINIPSSSTKINYEIRIDVNTYSLNQLESIFIEISRPDLPGGIIGLTCKHPSINLSTFNTEFFGTLLKNLNNENTEVILTCEFNVNFISFGKKRIPHQFLKKLFHDNCTPQITLPTGTATLIYIHHFCENKNSQAIF